MRAWVIAIAVMVSAPAWADDWVAYKSKTGGVAVSFPGGPTESTKDADGNTLHLAVYSELGGGEQYMLLWADRAKNAAKETVKQMFDDAQAPMANRAKVVSSKDFTYRGLPARDVDLLSPDRKDGAKLRMVIKKQRIYLLLATVVVPADVKKFIDSLRID